MADQRLWRVAKLGQRIGLKAKVRKSFDRIKLRFCQRFRQFPPRIGKETQRACLGNTGIELAQTARSGISWVGKDLVTSLGLARIQSVKSRVAHIDFAAHFQYFGCVFNMLRNISNGARIGGDIFTFCAIPTGGGLH